MGGLRLGGFDGNTLYNSDKVLGFTTLNNINFNTGTSLANYTTRMTIDTTGNVGLTGILTFGSRVQDFLIKLCGNNYGFGINSGMLRYNSGGSHTFFSGGVQRVNFDSSGNVGIGFNPFAPLCIGNPLASSDGALVI